MSRPSQTKQTMSQTQPDSPERALAELKEALASRQASQGENYRVTPEGLWTRSDLDEVLALFMQLDWARYGRMVDLGSGDGRVVCLASYFTRAVGMEADPWLVGQSRRLAAELGLDRAEFQQTDLRVADLSSYDLLYIFPDKPLHWLEQMPAESWQGELLVYGPGFQPKGLKHLTTLYAGSTMCALWCH